MKNILDIFLPYQKKFFLNDKRRKIWISSRQIGKSFTIAGILCYKSLSKKNGLSLCISTGSRAASEIIRKCEQFAEAIKVLSDGEIDYTSSFDSIKFNNGSRVLSLPSSTDGSNLRGYTGNCVCIDEAAYVSHLGNIMNAINPTLSRDDNAELILTTTPAGKNGDFYELYSNAINDDNWYVQYTTIHDAINDGLNANLQSLKTLCPDKDVFAQEYECQFLSEYGSLIDVSLIDYYDDLPTGNRTDYLGMDIGSKSDRSAIVILRKIGEVVYLDDIVVLNKMEYNQQLQMVKEIHNINKFNAGYIDETGIGSAFAEFVKKNVSSKINGFTFTGSNKTPMYEKLRSLIYEHKLKVNIKFKSIIEKDFKNVQRVVNEAGQVKYIAGHDENGHSDITSGLVLGIRAIDDNPVNFQMPIQYIRQSIF